MARIARLRPAAGRQSPRDAAARRAARARAPGRRQGPVRGQHALHQHDPRQRAGAVSRATARSSAASRASSGGTRWRWSCAATASRTASAATSRPSRRRRRSTRWASTISSAARTPAATRTSSTSRATPSPGIYSRGFLEGRFNETHLRNFRHELRAEPGLSSYPHPWLMPDFWEFPTVSMGLGPLMAIYQARFARYLENRGLKEPSDQKVWAFLGDGETDEPEALGSISLAAREKLDNLIFVINCNLQRLDGPVRGNGQIIQELESVFRGAGWNVIKVIWGSEWDDLLARDTEGAARQAHGRGRRRRVPALRRRRRRLHPEELLGRRSAPARDGAAPVGRRAEEDDARRSRSGEGLQRLSRGRCSTRAARRSSWREPSRATASAKRARARTSPTSRRR